jgi:hypothetical protein
MSRIGEIQEAIGQLPEKEKSVLAAWLQSQDEPLLSQQEEAKLLAALDQAALELDAEGPRVCRSRSGNLLEDITVRRTRLIRL